jgi:DNA-binding SARP family transcriptional activator
MTPEGGSTSDQSAAGWADWRQVCELLKAGHYQQVAQLLGEAQATGQQRGDAGLAQILAAARRICLASSQSQAEAEWHENAYQQADQREREFRQQLQAILDLITEGEAPEPPEEGEVSLLPSTSHERETRSTTTEMPAVHPAAREEEPAPPSLAIYCLGSFRVYQDDELVNDWPSGKGKCIFKYMMAHRDRPIAKDILMDLFWRDAGPEAARNNLNVAIYGLRQALRAARPDFAHILYQDDHYLLNPAMEIWVDVEEFVRRYEMGRNLERKGKLVEAMREYEAAEGLYQGDFLEEDLYQDWPIPRREGLKDSYLTILDRLSRHYLEEERYGACIHVCRRILAEDDCREDAHRRLMRCYSQQGQRNLALRQYHLCVETLARVLDVSPMPETVTLYQQIREREVV